MDCRFLSLELTNFKNIKHGLIEAKSNNKNKSIVYDKSDIIGLYGQNGSGKSSVLVAIQIMKLLILGSSFDNEFSNFINIESEYCSIKINFAIKKENHEYILSYYVNINKSTFLVDEKLEIKNIKNNVKININFDSEKISPAKVNTDLKIKNSKVDNLVELKLAKKDRCSFIFSPYFLEFTNNNENYKLINELKDWITTNLFVILNDHSSFINSKSDIPFLFRIETSKTFGWIMLPINSSRKLNDKSYNILLKIIDQTNKVLPTLVPDLLIKLHLLEKNLNEKGEEEYVVELVSLKGEISLPIRYESDGIIKLISILNLLIAAYNDKNICICIDEFDSGVFEYLLGEMLKVFNEKAKGQIIFTSHNLRPLEMLDTNDIWFTTSNEKNRFLQFKNIKTNNNLRDSYYRAILLGGQKEELYKQTNNIALARALHLASEGM